MPGLPTVAESRLSGFQSTVWSGLLLPAGSAAPIVDRLNREVVRIVKLPDVQDRFANLGFDPIGSTRQEFRSYVRSEIARWFHVVRQGGIKVE